MEETFKVGDWVFCEFKLSLIRSVEDGRVKEVTDGMFSHSGYDLSDRCKPLTYEMKQVADAFHYHSQRIHREGVSGLNYPDIHRWLVAAWVDACNTVTSRDELTKAYACADKFVQTLLSKQNPDSGYGFSLMRSK